MTINFYLNRDPRSSKKEKSIYCYIREGSKTMTLFTGDRIDPKYWDVKLQKAKRSYIGHPELNDFLDSFKNSIQAIIRRVKSKDPFVSFEEISKQILKDTNRRSDYDLYQTMDIFINTRRPTVSKETTGKFTSLKKHLMQFCSSYKIKPIFESIDLSFFDNLNIYFLSIGISNNTIYKNMQFIKSFLRWAYDREYTNNNKFEEYGNIKTVETDSIALTKEDLDKLLSCDALNEKLQKVRDVFMFQLYTGQRYSDIQEFRMTDVKNNIWTLRQQKTKKQLEVPLVEVALAILEKYKGILPVISNQKANKYLKELGLEAGLNDLITITKYSGAERFDKQFAKYELLTTHTARRTFVSLASNYGINQQVVKAITGHGTDKMVGKYYKVNASDSLRNLETVFNN